MKVFLLSKRLHAGTLLVENALKLIAILDFYQKGDTTQ